MNMCFCYKVRTVCHTRTRPIQWFLFTSFFLNEAAWVFPWLPGSARPGAYLGRWADPRVGSEWSVGRTKYAPKPLKRLTILIQLCPIRICHIINIISCLRDLSTEITIGEKCLMFHILPTVNFLITYLHIFEKLFRRIR